MNLPLSLSFLLKRSGKLADLDDMMPSVGSNLTKPTDAVLTHCCLDPSINFQMLSLKREYLYHRVYFSLLAVRCSESMEGIKLLSLKREYLYH